MKKIEKTSLRILRKTIHLFKIFEKDERILIAFSGGKDSLFLTEILHLYKLRYGGIDFIVAHVNPKMPDWDTQKIEEYFKQRGFDYVIIEEDIWNKIKDLKHPCYLCSRLRKMTLFKWGEKRGIKTFAFAHHAEDVIETFFMNMAYNARAETIKPVQYFFEGRIKVVRPIYRFTQELIDKFLKEKGISEIQNICPFAKDSLREKIRPFLDFIYKSSPFTKYNLFQVITSLSG